MRAGITNYRHEPQHLAWSDIFGNSLGLGKLYVSLRFIFSLSVTLSYTGQLYIFILELFGLEMMHPWLYHRIQPSWSPGFVTVHGRCTFAFLQ